MRKLHFIGAILILFSSPASAKDAVTWILAQKSGDVRVLRDGVQAASVQLRSSLAPGDLITTGATGRAMLTNGDDYVIVAPSSRLFLPKGQQQSGFTRLVQQVGTMLYKVKHTGVPHFAVDTPMLAAVVKGTRFTVVVDKDRAAVQVTEGVVEVSSAVGNARRLVEGGMTVYIGRERPGAIIEMKPGAASLPNSGRDGSDAVQIQSSGDVSLGTIADLTFGLVREAPSTTVALVSTAPVSNVESVTPVSNSTSSPATDAAAPTTGSPVAAVSTTTVAAVTDPVVGIADATVPAITDPVVAVIEPAVTTVTDPVALVDPVVAVIEPVVAVVEPVVATVTDPVVAVVEPVVTTVTDPVVPVVEPVVAVVDPVITTVTQPASDVVGGLLGFGKGP